MKKIVYVVLLVLSGYGAFAQELYQLPQGASRVSSMESLNGIKGRGGQSNHGGKGSAYVTLKAGATQELLNVSGSGMIQRIWLTVQDRSPEMLRGLRLRMYWDDSAEPAVDAPLGDFFCCPFGMVPFENALFSTAEGRSFNCYIPMPYRKGARITLSNETQKDQRMLFFDVDFVKCQEAKDALYFHAIYSRRQYPVSQPVELLSKITGKGRFLGVSIGLNVNPLYGATWWGEGEVKMYLDGDTPYPTICGTGSEDYLGSGWELGTFTGRYQGCLVAKDTQYAFYRLHIPDQVVFQQDCHVTLQQLGGGPAATVRDLQAKGVALQPVNITHPPRFVGLLDSKDPQGELRSAGAHEWVCFERSDDYAVTSYYYLNKP